MTEPKCPHHNPKLRPGLPELTERIARLPVDGRGYPIPVFASYPNGRTGEPDFRMADSDHLVRCIKERIYVESECRSLCEQAQARVTQPTAGQ